MKWGLLVLMLLQTIHASAIQEVHGGGGGVDAAGHYMTFYSAQIPILNKPLEEDEIPGLTLLIDTIFDLTLPETQKDKILKSISPDSHTYFKVDETKIPDDEKAQILDQYAQLMGVSKTDLTLFAVSTPDSNTTILFDSFFKLKQSEQAAILFHEAMWLLLPKDGLNYTNIISIEMRTQAYLENPQDADAYYSFYNQLGQFSDGDDQSYMIDATLTYDLKMGNLKSPGLKNGQVYVSQFIGPDAFNCIASNQQQCPEVAQKFFRQLREKKSPGLLFRTLADHVIVPEFISSESEFDIASKYFQGVNLNDVYIDFNQSSRETNSYNLYTKASSEAVGRLEFQ